MGLERYRKETFKFPDPGGSRLTSHDVYYRLKSDAAPVIVLHELFGLSPAAIELGDFLANSFSVYLPVLFGRPGKDGLANAARAFCVRREFTFLFTGKTSPVATWVRGLAGVAAQRAGNRPVGLIGMCLTGGVVFSAIADPAVGAGVASQPSLPFPLLGHLTPQRVRRDLGTSLDDLREAASSSTDVMMLRYHEDAMCPAERADAAALVFGGVGEARRDPQDGSVSVAEGDRITIVEIVGNRHSVLGVDLNTRARQIVKDFLEQRLARGVTPS
jgi:dienelactone hydrolase